MMVRYLVACRDPGPLVAVAWEPMVGSFVGRIQGLAATTRPGPDGSTVACVLGPKVRAALQADQAGHAPPAPASRTASRRRAPWRLATAAAGPDGQVLRCYGG